MYHEKFAVVVRAGGKVLRERNETVLIPFGTEYSLRLKNLNTVRALVRVEIDGKDIADGERFIVQPNSSIDIERFLRGGNKDAGNRFKFIERTARVENARGGIQVEDGLIRVEFEFEREQVAIKDFYRVPTPVYDPYPWRPYRRWDDYPYWGSGPWIGSGQITYTAGSSESLKGQAQATVNSVFAANANVGAQADSVSLQASSEQMYSNAADVPRSRSVNDAGITAPGSVSHQKFQTGYIGALDGVKHAMVLKLVGEVGEVKISKPVTVKAKQRCVTCDHLNKATSRFCSECGTALEIVA